jgi:16S rRNA (cytidine1402-2'-O)-methyltransferase
MAAAPGKLYLLPTPLGEGVTQTIPAYVKEIMFGLRYFIAEKPKTARHFLKASGFPVPLSDCTYYELNKRTRPEERQRFLDPALEGADMGLLSEAGCPGVADPGAEIVNMAHRKGVEVVPLVGPSSILLALMASGMNGQQFCFHGYLPPKKPELAKALKQLEQQSKKNGQTQIFIETPYRNTGMMDVAFQVLSPSTKWCVAVDLTLPDEWIATHSIQEWKHRKIPDLHKRPAIFLLQG